MTSPYWAAMPTCAARQDARERSLNALLPHRVSPELFANEDPELTPRQRHNENLHEIFEAFAGRPEPYLLYLEDDIEVAQSFGAHLRRAMLADFDVVSFFNPNRNFYTPAVLETIDAGGVPPSSLYPAAGKSSWYSALALLIHRPAAGHIARHMSRADDVSLDTSLQTAPVSIYCAVPNPVNHQDVPSATSARHWGGRIRSISYRG